MRVPPCQTPPVPPCDALPLLWLLSDVRNDRALTKTLAALPPGSGFVFRHYHLPEPARRARFLALAGIARGCGHCVILAGSPEVAAEWGADGIYGAPEALASADAALLQLATAHDEAELAAAERAGADGVFLSPVFPTRSHPDGDTLGADRFLSLARGSPLPVIALGGMTAARAAQIGWPRWGAIDGLVSTNAA